MWTLRAGELSIQDDIGKRTQRRRVWGFCHHEPHGPPRGSLGPGAPRVFSGIGRTGRALAPALWPAPHSTAPRDLRTAEPARLRLPPGVPSRAASPMPRVVLDSPAARAHHGLSSPGARTLRLELLLPPTGTRALWRPRLASLRSAIAPTRFIFPTTSQPVRNSI